MQVATSEFLSQFQDLCEKRKYEIRNTKDIDGRDICGYTYYVSNDGDDSNDGLTPQTAWKSLKKASPRKKTAWPIWSVF